MDRMLRPTIGRWLALRNDTPTGYSLAHVREEDRGITSARWRSPSIIETGPGTCAWARLNNIADPHLANKIRQSDQRLTERISHYRSENGIKKLWAALHGTVGWEALTDSVLLTN